MRSRIRRILSGRVRGPWIVAGALLLALAIAPFAGAFGEGRSLRGGARNPSSRPSQTFTRETQIIANSSTYGTRQSNKSDNGGGAIYGCRSADGGTEKGNQPCVRAANLSNGRAFEFDSRSGTEVGRISSGNPNAAPFVTNARGVATGLNADKVDGRNADDVVTDARSFNKFANVNGADAALSASRGVKAAARTAAGVYTVTFDSDVSKCARTATISAATATTATTEASATPDTLVVHTFDIPGGAAADHTFSLLVTC
jgi:hypothetical protein